MKRAQNYANRGLALLLTLTLALSPLPSAAAADGANTPKEEVIYINLAADGSVEEINAVNIFEMAQAGEIVDYGRYQSLRNMTSTAPVNYSGEKVTIDAEAGKLYYEGKLEETVMPWTIQLSYFMDGTEYSAQELAGKSGALKIHLKIAENSSCRGEFYDNYALQASLTLDTDQCKNIVADSATVANVGSDKQLTYTILPGKGIDTDITADVTDFEMDGISINGIPLNLDVDVDDEELLDRVTDLMDAVVELDDGAGELDDGVSELQDRSQNDLQKGVSDLCDGTEELRDGTEELQDGGSTLKDGAAELDSGAGALNEGVRSLDSGIEQIQKALTTLNGQSSTLRDGSAAFQAALSQLQAALSGVSVTAEDLSALADASAQIKDGIDQIVDGAAALQSGVSFDAYCAAMSQNGLDIGGLKQKNSDSAKAIQDLASSLKDQIAALQQAGMDTTALSGQLDQLQNIAALLAADNAAIGGTESYLDAANQNISALLEGAQTLQSSYKTFDDTIQTLVNTLGSLAYQMSELSDAVNTLVSEYEKLDAGITSYTDGVAQIVAGYSQVSDGASQLVTGSASLKTGADQLYGGTDDLLSGIDSLCDGTGELKDGSEKLDDGVDDLLSGIDELHDGTGELKDGTSTMREETADMDTEVNDQIDELLESVTGGDLEVESFVSDQNSNVESVQFVIQSEGISAEEEEPAAPAAKPELTVWQKLLKLFGLYHQS